jgi:hypothetical protein
VNRGFDAGLRAVHLASLERDFRWAELGVLGEVIMPTKWPDVRRRWHFPPNGIGGVTVTVHDLPPLRSGDVFFSGPGPGAGAGIAMRRRIGGSLSARDLPDPLR